MSVFDELRLFGFVEGPNLKVDGGGYGLRDGQLRAHRALTEGVIYRRAWNEENICCHHRGRDDRWFARRYAGKREAWRSCRRLGYGLLSRSRALRLRQLRMGDEALLGRPWLAGPSGASLLLICDYAKLNGW